MSGIGVCGLLVHVGPIIFTKGLMGLITSVSLFSSGGVCLSLLTWLSISMIIILSLNHIGVCQSCMLGHSYFTLPDYLVVKAWIEDTVLFPSFINLTSTNIHVYPKVFPGCRVLQTRYTLPLYCDHGQCGTSFYS